MRCALPCIREFVISAIKPYETIQTTKKEKNTSKFDI